jgi:V/A-type H+-transporting ATPase subunit B
VNPVRRKQPSELIATGIAGIDLNNTLVTGQKIPFFADSDQPYNEVMANVALKAQADKIILGGMGLSNDDYLYFKALFENAGALDKIISFINTTENPPVERLLVPDMALAAAEYFAVDKNEKVLVLLTDMTLYADALAIVSNKMDQIPSKDSMPGSLYSDLAKIYEKPFNSLMADPSPSSPSPPLRRGYHPCDTGQHGLHHRGAAVPANRYRYR